MSSAIIALTPSILAGDVIRNIISKTGADKTDVERLRLLVQNVNIKGQKLKLIPRECNIGQKVKGFKWVFVCDCGKECYKLYSPMSAKFACNKCHKLRDSMRDDIGINGQVYAPLKELGKVAKAIRKGEVDAVDGSRRMSEILYQIRSSSYYQKFPARAEEILKSYTSGQGIS